MLKNSASKTNEFDKLNNMKDKLKNSKTLNLSLINKNIIRSNNNSDKNIMKISPRNEKDFVNSESKNTINIKNNINNPNKNIIIIDSNENHTERKDFKYSDSIKDIEQKIIQESDIAVYVQNKDIYNKNPSDMVTSTDKCLESDAHRYNICEVKRYFQIP